MELALVYPHQLFRDHPAVVGGRGVLLIEDPLLFGNDPEWPLAVHKQRLVLFRAAMRAYAEEMKEAGFRVGYVETPEGDRTDSAGVLREAVGKRVKKLHLCDPCDDVLGRRVRRFAMERGIAVEEHPSPNFLTPPGFLKQHTGAGSRPFLARFYEAQRKRMGLLLASDGGPLGGKWSLDAENRKRFPKGAVPPAEPRAASCGFVREAVAYTERRFPGNPGGTAGFRWAVTRAGAESWLETFLDERLGGFGDYEDAVAVQHPFLYHSAISPMLNAGLLDPADIVRRVISRHEGRHPPPLNSVEGFVRQVIGWREFLHGIYRHRGGALRRGNFWGFTRPIPRSLYDGSTGIPPVDRVVRAVLRDGYCHHIERLMVLGNFMLLCRIRPDDVWRWFMEMFVDAHDWVMVPNVYGMSQFADGGTFTTKPYLSGSNYLLKMSDEGSGPWCSVWDALFWTFIADHGDFFRSNPRLSMMSASWRKMPDSKKDGHRRTAEEFLAQL
jgi:deoxyribodipyrimidine photolyase-related protein